MKKSIPRSRMMYEAAKAQERRIERLIEYIEILENMPDPHDHSAYNAWVGKRTGMRLCLKIRGDLPNKLARLLKEHKP